MFPRKMTDADIISELSRIIHSWPTTHGWLENDDQEMQTMRSLVDELEYRWIVCPTIESDLSPAVESACASLDSASPVETLPESDFGQQSIGIHWPLCPQT